MLTDEASPEMPPNPIPSDDGQSRSTAWDPRNVDRRPVSLRAANDFCRRYARQHEENFTVASLFLPRELRRHFYHIYAYCRWSDNLADTSPDTGSALEQLAQWEQQLDDAYRGRATHPVFVALTETIEEFQIPAQPFRDLLSAFRQDQRQTRYLTVDELLDYCRRSANPVGRLVLHLGRSVDATNLGLSDSICTGLQLANFCQDVARDFARGRIYLPVECWHAHGYSEAMFERREFNPAFQSLLSAEVERAEAALRHGWPLVDRLPGVLAIDVELFVQGGLAILDRIRGQGYDVWRRRPVVGKWRKLRLLAGAWFRRRFPAYARHPRRDAGKSREGSRVDTEHGSPTVSCPGVGTPQGESRTPKSLGAKDRP